MVCDRYGHWLIWYRPTGTRLCLCLKKEVMQIVTRIHKTLLTKITLVCRILTNSRIEYFKMISAFFDFNHGAGLPSRSQDQTRPDFLIYFFKFIFSLIFLFVPCHGLSWLHVSFLLHVKYTISYHVVSYSKRTDHYFFFTMWPHCESRLFTLHVSAQYQTAHKWSAERTKNFSSKLCLVDIQLFLL